MEQMLDLPEVVFAVSLPAVIKPLGSRAVSGDCSARRPKCATACAECGCSASSWTGRGSCGRTHVKYDSMGCADGETIFVDLSSVSLSNESTRDARRCEEVHIINTRRWHAPRHRGARCLER